MYFCTNSKNYKHLPHTHYHKVLSSGPTLPTFTKPNQRKTTYPIMTTAPLHNRRIH